ncbi:MAG: hydantoinase B/oxoprolinase family protein, partial [Deltaproteobacteria bacterium]|nr:hydantoinase B/oxoprolinase family protein [Deltaproteobacteria bacterium]
MEMPVPGSEYFDNDINAPDIIRMRMSSKLKLHTVDDEFIENIDLVIYEILRHRILMVTQEMGETMRKMSGSMVVTEINDFETSITDEIGEAIYMGPYNTEQGGAMDLAVKWTLENRSENPGIEEGDIFHCNDPYVGGGLHQSDVCLYGPLFWEGEIFCWTTAICHELDIGGSELAGLGINAKNIFQEPVPTPPIKLVRQGEILLDVEEAFLRRSRLPSMVALDLRSKIGAVNVGNGRILEMIQKYGADTVKAVMKRIMNETEEKLRTKLRRLPDGKWSSFVYQDQARAGDRGIYKIVLNMSKKGDQLTFDFTGTDPQMAGPSNCAFSGLRGGLLGAVLPIMCGDIPWSPGGILRCIDIISEKGTLNNASFPAAVCKAPWASGWASGTTAIDCLSKMLNTTPDLQEHVWARSSGTYQANGACGMDMRSSPPAPYIAVFADPMGGGLGARSDKDGVDMGGHHMLPAGRLGDVEMFEYMNPFIYL